MKPTAASWSTVPRPSPNSGDASSERGEQLQAHEESRKAEADLTSLVDFSVARFGSDATLRLLDNLDRCIEALARHEYEGPEARIGSRARPVRRWPVPPYWLYYDRLGKLSACFASIMAPASRSEGSRWKSGAAAARIKSVDVGHFDFRVPLLKRVPSLSPHAAGFYQP
jgi:plasmid stabilization system protein ParE